MAMLLHDPSSLMTLDGWIPLPEEQLPTWAHRTTVTLRAQRPPASSSLLCRSICASAFPHWSPHVPR
jgi:hypothetical protein